MLAERWTSVTSTEYPHEREAFDQLRAALPDAEPYRAWSNFTFTSDTGRPYEVDVLVLGPAGFLLIEVKSWVGDLAMHDGRWVKTARGRQKDFDNPFHLADAKAKKLGGLLRAEPGDAGVRVPFVSAAVYFSKAQLTVDLPAHQRHGLYGRPPGLPDIGALLTAPPRDRRAAVTAGAARKLTALLGRIGVNESRRYYRVGAWSLDRQPFEEGPTWQDHLATHAELPAERRRVRLYLVERRALAAQRESVERAARREIAALHGIDHPHIVRVDALEGHEAGPALVYRYDPRSVRLDRFLAERGDRLAAGTRLALVRQLAEAVAYAHRHRLYHRALSARSVLVVPGPGAGDEQAWERPRLEIIDWNVASRARAADDDPAVSGTVHASMHLADAGDAYLAPEWRQGDADPIALDVFGVGAVAYALLTGAPPAPGYGELLHRLAVDNGLLPSAAAPHLPPSADDLVQPATAPVPARRTATMDELLERLDDLERDLTAPRRAADPAVDPLEAEPGDRIGDWVVDHALGTGSTSRAFVVRDAAGERHVLKVALSPAKTPRLVHEAAVLRRLRDDSRTIRLQHPDVLTIAGRAALLFEYVSRETLARRLRTAGPLPPAELESYGDELIGAVAFLEGENLHHRDLKPDNIVIRTRAKGPAAPVLFDFSLADLPAADAGAGTPRYLDPFLGTADRTSYDDAAERYALAVTLHELASATLPTWGDGRTEPRFTTGPPVLAAAAFPAGLRAGLVAFFGRALHRDAAQRFASLRDMRLAWADVFRAAGPTAPAPEPAPPVVPPGDSAASAPAVAAALSPSAGFSASVVHAAPVVLAAAYGSVGGAAGGSDPARPAVADAAVPAPGGGSALPPGGVPAAAPGPSRAAGSAVRSADPAGTAGGVALPEPVTAADLDRARRAVATALARRGGPLPMSRVGTLIMDAAPAVHATRWAGYGRLLAFVRAHLPEYRHVPGNGGDGALHPPPRGPAAPDAASSVTNPRGVAAGSTTAGSAPGGPAPGAPTGGGPPRGGSTGSGPVGGGHAAGEPAVGGFVGGGPVAGGSAAGASLRADPPEPPATPPAAAPAVPARPAPPRPGPPRPAAARPAGTPPSAPAVPTRPAPPRPAPVRPAGTSAPPASPAPVRPAGTSPTPTSPAPARPTPAAAVPPPSARPIPAAPAGSRPSGGPSPGGSGESVEPSAVELTRARRSIRAALLAHGPLSVSMIGDVLVRETPTLYASKWAGRIKLTTFLADHLPEFTRIDTLSGPLLALPGTPVPAGARPDAAPGTATPNTATPNTTTRPTTRDSITQDAATHSPATKNPATKNPATKQSTAKNPTDEQSAAKQPAGKQPPAPAAPPTRPAGNPAPPKQQQPKQPSPKQSAAKQPAAKQPAAKQSAAKQPAPGQPPAKQPSAKPAPGKPAAAGTPAAKPASPGPTAPEPGPTAPEPAGPAAAAKKPSTKSAKASPPAATPATPPKQGGKQPGSTPARPAAAKAPPPSVAEPTRPAASATHPVPNAPATNPVPHQPAPHRRTGLHGLPADRRAALVERARAVLRAALAARSPHALPLAAAARLVRDAVPGLAPDWLGTADFTVFLAVHLPEFAHRPDPDGWVHLPLEQRMRARLADLWRTVRGTGPESR
ncbi:hypothetical protein GCM10010123_07240 [Pilimelia anulata]|uniref:Non-specific serine/threonine protein kinase n=2 Tax=Pilimelia anulata TaxID=53371 RepID=A0A8J3B738_9ACTN|nr:hypothetical protein GCM10010123_07240 [Pilimelia anulata]